MSYYTDDCVSAADVMERARRVREMRRTMMATPADVTAPVAPIKPTTPKTLTFLAPKTAAGKRVLAELRSISDFKPVPALQVAGKDNWPGSMMEIIGIAAAYFNVRREDILSESHRRSVVAPRAVAMFIANKTRGRTLPEIGIVFRRDHTTVLHATRRIAAAIDDGDLEIAKAVKEITEEFERRAALRPSLPQQPKVSPALRWTDEEIADLERFYVRDGKKTREVAKLLNRSTWSIEKKVVNLGLSKKRQMLLASNERGKAVTG
jgi:hypothetical protein